jgi:uracil-DNA glycosylase
MGQSLAAILEEARACRLCEANLPEPRPVVFADKRASLLIIGQAPGTKVHATGIPWNDPSGDRLRDWLQMDHEEFYNPTRLAIVPMGFCYPGKGRSGDLPPRPECAPLWHDRLLSHMPNVELVLLIGQYAQNYYLGDKRNLTDRVRDFQDYGPRYFPLPHPSPRNQMWLRRNSWFDTEVLPALRRRLAKIQP